MTRDEIYKFINDNPVFAMATCENGPPRVRMMRLFRANENGILFNTSRHKEVFGQFTSNPTVELCFHNEHEGVQIRIRGQAMLVKDHDLRHEVIAKLPIMVSAIMHHGNEDIATFSLEQARAKVWRMGEGYDADSLSNMELSSIWMAAYDGAPEKHHRTVVAVPHNSHGR